MHLLFLFIGLIRGLQALESVDPGGESQLAQEPGNLDEKAAEVFELVLSAS